MQQKYNETCFHDTKNKLLGKGTALILPTPSALSTSILSLHAHFVKFCGVDYILKYALT